MKAGDKTRGYKNKRAVIHENEQRISYCGGNVGLLVGGVVTQDAPTVDWLNDCPNRFRHRRI
jgi:hypothetical protein